MDTGYLQLSDPLLGTFGIDKNSSKGNYSQFEGTYTAGTNTKLLVTFVNNEENIDDNNITFSNDNIVLTYEHSITKLIIRGKAVGDKTSYLFQLFHDMVVHSNLFYAQDKAIANLKSQCSHMKHVVMPTSKFTVSGMMDENMSGMQSVNILCDDLLPNIDNN